MTANIADRTRPGASSDELTRRDFALHDEFLQALIEHETLQAEIPNGALLVLLPDDDPDLTERNLAWSTAAAQRGLDVYIRHVHRSPAAQP